MVTAIVEFLMKPEDKTIKPTIETKVQRFSFYIITIFILDNCKENEEQEDSCHN